jgi:hypothetical protein
MFFHAISMERSMIIPRPSVRLLAAIVCGLAIPAVVSAAPQLGAAEPALTSERVLDDLRERTIPLSSKGDWRIERGDSLRAVLMSVLRDSARVTATVHLQSWRGREGAPPVWLEGEVDLVYERIADGGWGMSSVRPSRHQPPRATKMSAATWKERQQVDEFVTTLRGALDRDDRSAVIRMVRLPFTGHPATYDDRSGESVIRNEKELRGLYDSLFGGGFRAGIMRSLVSKSVDVDDAAADRVHHDRCGEPGEYVVIADNRDGVDTFFRFVIRRIGGRLLLYRIVGCM